MKISAYGASDDNVEVHINDKWAEEFSAYNTKTWLHIDSKDGGVDISLFFGQSGWEITVVLPDRFEDNQSVLPVQIRMSETGYSYEAIVEVDDASATLLVVQNDVTQAVLGTNGKLIGWKDVVEAREADERCSHGMYKTGAVGKCPRCSRARGAAP